MGLLYELVSDYGSKIMPSLRDGKDHPHSYCYEVIDRTLLEISQEPVMKQEIRQRTLKMKYMGRPRLE